MSAEERQPLLSSSSNNNNEENNKNIQDEEKILSPKEVGDTMNDSQTKSKKTDDDEKKEESENKKDNDDDEEDYEDSQMKKPEFKVSAEERAKIRSFWMIVVICCYSVLIITWLAVLLAPNAVKINFRIEVPAAPLSDNATYQKLHPNSSRTVEFLPAWDVKNSVGDLFVVDCVRSLPMIVFFFILRAKPDYLHPYLFHFSMLMWFIVTAKAWTFESYAANLNAIPMWISLFTSTISLYGHNRIYDCDIPPNLILSWTGITKVMGPYILPTNPYARVITLALWLVVALSKASTLVSPIILGEAVSDLIHRNLYDACMKLIIFGFLQVAPKFLESAQDAVATYVWMQSYREVAEESFSHCLNLDLQWHITKKLGKVMRSIDRAINASEQLMGWIAMWAVPNIGSGILSFVVFVIHFQQPELAAVCWLSLCLYIWVTVVITKFRRRFNEKENVHDNDAHDNSTDAMVNIEVVKAFTNEDFEIKNYVESVKKQQTFNYKGQLFTGFVNVSQGTIIQICTVASLALAGIHAVHNTPQDEPVNVGTFVAISQYMTNLFAPLSFIGTLYSMTITALVDIQNLAEILEQKPDVADAPDAVDFREHFPLIADVPKKEQEGISVEFENVCFHYPAQDPDKGLKNVSFKVNAGETLAICGTTGSGKSTIATKLVFGFYQPQSGSIKFNGVDSRKFKAKSLRKEIGIVPQDTILFNESLRYNVAYGKPDATEEEIENAVEVSQLKPALERFTKGLDTVVGERGTRCSGGERQRVALARCILKDPSVMVFDEATSSLDNETEKQLSQSLETLSGGKRTSIVVAHRLTTIQNATQILVMEKGEILERGSHEELLAMKGRYHNLWTAQKKAAEEEVARQASVKTIGENGDEEEEEKDEDDDKKNKKE